jgi:hypothetical protein
MDVSSTAQVLGSLGQLDLASTEGLGLAILVAFLASKPLQAMVEGIIAGLLPAPLFFLKPFLPSAIASALGGVAIHLGVTPEDAIGGAAALANFTHWANSQPWAVDLEKKYPKDAAVVEEALGAPSSGVTGKSMALLLAFLLAGLAGHAKAGILDFPVTITPTAGATVLNNTVILMPSMLKIDSGKLTFDVNGYAGAASTLQWGPNYGAGLTVGILAQGIATNVNGDLDITGFAGELAGGVVGDWLGIDGAVLWAVDGARLGLTKPF